MNHSTDTTPRQEGRGPSECGKAIIALRDAGTKQAVIATRFGITIGAVKQTLRRYRKSKLLGYG